jgi:hypothetical protein
MLFQLVTITVLALLIWGAVRTCSIFFRITALLFGSFVFLHWLTSSPRNFWTLFYELAGLAVLLFLLAAAMGGLRRSRW